MSKKQRRVRQDAPAPTDTETDTETAPGAVGPRQPCPCGSGRRYKNCHGAPGGGSTYVRRPFEGLTSEADVVALRDFVPAATAPLTLTGEHADRPVLLASLLPGASPALVRPDGTVWLGLQVQHAYGDASRDLAAVLLKALEAEPGDVVGLPEDPGAGPRLQDLVAPEALTVTVHPGFDYWVSDLEDVDGSVGEALAAANDAAAPTARLTEVEAAYWTSVGDREYLRWVLARDEDQVLDGLARLHAAGEDHLLEGGRLIGMFRTQGLAVPVWDVPVGTGAEALESPVAALWSTLQEAMADTGPLSADERAARAGLASRQLTIR